MRGRGCNCEREPPAAPAGKATAHGVHGSDVEAGSEEDLEELFQQIARIRHEVHRRTGEKAKPPVGDAPAVCGVTVLSSCRGSTTGAQRYLSSPVVPDTVRATARPSSAYASCESTFTGTCLN